MTELLDVAGDALGDAPDIVSQQMDRIEGFLADLERAKQLVDDAVAEAQLLQQRAADKAAELQQQADAAVAAAEQLRDDVVDAVDTIVLALEDLIGAGQAQVETALSTPLQELRDLTTQMEQVAPQLPPLVRQQLLSIAGVLRNVTDAADRSRIGAVREPADHGRDPVLVPLRVAAAAPVVARAAAQGDARAPTARAGSLGGGVRPPTICRSRFSQS